VRAGLLADVDPRQLRKVLLTTYERAPERFETVLATEGLGPKAQCALVLCAELIYGTKASARDPAHFSFAHGGKDRTRYLVDRATYDGTIEVLRNALGRARKIDRFERILALRRLAAFTSAPATQAIEAARTGGAPQSTYTP
jgi:uncharacterized protein